MPGPARNASLASAASDRQPERAPMRHVERGSDRSQERKLERPDDRRLTDDGRFSIDMNKVPRGYVMEFKRHSIMGMQDTRNQVLVRRYHWQPVPHSMQPHFYGHLNTDPDKQVVVDGMGLYMRPRYLNDEAMAETRYDTDHQLSQQLQSLRLSSKDQVGDKNTYIKKQTVAVPQPVE